MLTTAQARDLIDHFGGHRAAARGVGIAESTLRYWLDPEATRTRMKDSYWSNAEPRRASARERYHGLSGPDYNRLLLRRRRVKALARIAQRSHKGE